TFTGITGVNTQDMALQEGMGPIVDRSKEHLGTSDRAIIVMRQLLMEAMNDLDAGNPIRGANPMTYRNVRAVDLVIAPAPDWREALKRELVARF
ncbi:MAG: Rieske 2Fe-2S domain-containing protein, partial [Candidatus Dormibacteria bacterium]